MDGHSLMSLLVAYNIVINAINNAELPSDYLKIYRGIHEFSNVFKSEKHTKFLFEYFFKNLKKHAYIPSKSFSTK